MALAGTSQPLRGVNLGNWLVLERWMGPAGKASPFYGAQADDELGLRRELGRAQAEARLARHRATYITEDDFAWLADHGCQLVRLPVPFFVFGDDKHASCIAQVDQALQWAATHGLRVLLDLHTVPGGQNGFDNGGACGLCTWHLSHAHVQDTLDVLERLARRFAGHPALWGIEPMNEPASPRIFAESMRRYGEGHPERVAASAPIPHAVLAQFYRLVHERVRPILGSGVALVLHDQFQLEAWRTFMPKDRFPNVWLDAHLYVGTAARGLHARSLAAHLALTRLMGARVAMAARSHPVIVGEWSLANNMGLEKGKRRDEAYRAFGRAQLAAFSRGGASCFWSLCNSRYGTWSLKAAVEAGWLDLRW